jgi:hypothetical protein
MKPLLFLMIMGLVLVMFVYSYAQVPQMINYQGKLTSNTGAPVNDTLQIVFSIYADSVGGTALWTETQPAVVIEKGVFNVLLGNVIRISNSVFNGDVRYLGVKVGSDPEITPRKPMVSVGYAFHSGTADTAKYSMPDADWVINGDNIYHLNGTVGIGTTSPNEQLEITGNLRLPATTATAGIIKVGADRFIHNYGTNNTFVGRNAGNLSMTGFSNTANGNQALYSNATGIENTACGIGALYANTTGGDNTANGSWALYANTTGGGNTACGGYALHLNTTGWGNTACGIDALISNTEGFENAATGSWALYANTTGGNNTANGGYALRFNATGWGNTACGDDALFSNTTGNYNTALGYAADVSAGDLTNATAIGNSAIVDASNEVRIGNTVVTSIGGQVDWTTFSDGRYKKNISENVPGLSFISKLKPVTFTLDVDAIDAALRPPYKPRLGPSGEDLKPSAEDMASKQAQSQIVYTGFIAQEVEQAAQEVGYNFSGVDAPKNDKGMYGLRYAEFVVPLVKAVQEQQQMIQDQQQTIQELQKRIEELEKK